MKSTLPPGYEISTDPARLDAGAIHAYLSRSYWAQGIPLEVVERSLAGSLCFGLYHQGKQVGLARMITDRATFAYLCDVYVLEDHRGKGLGGALMRSGARPPGSPRPAPPGAGHPRRARALPPLRLV